MFGMPVPLGRLAGVYLFDEYPTNPLFGFGLTRLLSTYSGTVIRVHRNTSTTIYEDFSLVGDDLNQTAIVDFVTDDGNSPTADGRIGRWYSQAGTIDYISASSLSAAPKIVDNGSIVTDGGQLALLSGGSDSLTSGSQGSATANNDPAIASVYTPSSIGTASPLKIAGNGHVEHFVASNGIPQFGVTGDVGLNDYQPASGGLSRKVCVTATVAANTAGGNPDETRGVVNSETISLIAQPSNNASIDVRTNSITVGNITGKIQLATGWNNDMQANTGDVRDFITDNVLT